MGVIPPKNALFRAVFTISNSTSFTYHRNFDLKLYMQHFEKMSPLYFLNVTIYGFLLFSKSAKCTRRSRRVFSLWILMLASISSTSSGSWTQALQVIRLCLHFWSIWYGWTITINDTTNLIASSLLWAGFLCWFFFPSPSLRAKHFKAKTDWSDTKKLIKPSFHIGF